MRRETLVDEFRQQQASLTNLLEDARLHHDSKLSLRLSAYTFPSRPIGGSRWVMREYARDDRIDLVLELRDADVHRYFGARPQQLTPAVGLPEQHDQCSDRVFRIHTRVASAFGAHVDIVSLHGAVADDHIDRHRG